MLNIDLSPARSRVTRRLKLIDGGLLEILVIVGLLVAALILGSIIFIQDPEPTPEQEEAFYRRSAEALEQTGMTEAYLKLAEKNNSSQD